MELVNSTHATLFICCKMLLLIKFVESFDLRGRNIKQNAGSCMDAGAIGQIIFRLKGLRHCAPPTATVSYALSGKSIDALRHTK